MTGARRLNLAWVALVILTLGGAILGETGVTGFWATVTVALITAVKGRLVIHHFMELDRASPVLRRLVGGFGLLVPLLVLVTWLWGPQLARIQWLGN